MEGFTQTLRQEVCKLGITVTSIQPGSVTVPDKYQKTVDPEVAYFFIFYTYPMFHCEFNIALCDQVCQ